ncbi:MutT/nudix family protein [Geomicrobium sp. JCM 19037]|uniref:NUDIX domain-containing protein n=1 Tax=Geomicrobium sp. JCM 19037 TaxID=1460634 RepID=UPI00045F1F0F|nr:NUDIX domain-containing protein [Geomicrobium sp. JCM 19037]GAK03581.1 MutT/nudix family protein [Geomicrobium sp. JCM 19037]
MKTVTKTTAYITRNKKNKFQLLTMIEEGVESYGIQVPGGTLEDDETLEQCLLREIDEESKLKAVEINEYLGSHKYYLATKQAMITRHYYLLNITEDCPDEFSVVVESDGIDNGWLYHYRWIDIEENQKIKLGGELGEYLDHLYNI